MGGGVARGQNILPLGKTNVQNMLLWAIRVLMIIQRIAKWRPRRLYCGVAWMSRE